MTQPNQSTLARKWKLDVNTGSVGSPTWTPVNGIAELTPSPQEPNIEDDNVYEDEGWGGATKTGLKWTIEAKLVRRLVAGVVTTYDPGQEKLRTCSSSFGIDGVANIRWYDREGGPEAYDGFAEVGWAPEGGSATDLETITVTLTGKGARTAITNPDASS
jgi:hypothetical protein